MEQLISIIVPIYKVEDYLDECIKSIVSQSYKNLEIILVDDGSPDKCGYICDMWAKEDKRITVIHKKNGGVSDARNIGVKVSKGQYILFIDSDDVINSDMVKVLYENIILDDYDISCCMHTKFKDGEKYIFNSMENLQKVIKNDLWNSLLKDEITGFVWDKLYKSELLKKNYFEKYTLAEDFIFNLKVLESCNKIITSTYIGYYYRSRENSALNVKDISKKLELVNASKSAKMYIESKGINNRWINYKFMVDNLLIHHQIKSINSDEVRKIDKILRKNIKDVILYMPFRLNNNQIKNVMYAYAFLLKIK